MSKITSSQIAAQQAWITPTLGTGWIAWDVGGAGNFGGPQYMKDSLGFVHVRGLAKNNSGASNTAATNPTIFTFPVGYRPGVKMRFTAVLTDAWGQLEVQDTGNLILSTNDTVTNGNWISLISLIFLAEN